MNRAKTGLKEFNSIIDGFPQPSAVLLIGPPGAGKTVFALSLIDTKDKAAKVVVLANNPPDEIKDEMKSFKIKLEPTFVDCYSWLAGKPAAIDSLANLNKLLFAIEDALSEGAHVVFDSLTPLLLYNHEDEIERFLQELIAIAKSKNCVLLFTLDRGTYHQDAENTVSALCDGIVSLDPEKGIRIVKMRDTKVPARDFFYELGNKGFRIRTK